MLRTLHKNGMAWLRLGIVTAAVLSFLGSALAISSDIDQDVSHAKHFIASVVDPGMPGEDPAQPAPDAKCHIGDGCIPMIMPGTGQLERARVDGAPEPRLVARGKPSRAGYPPFHPPRILSQV
jgi:hypothetical protein